MLLITLHITSKSRWWFQRSQYFQTCTVAAWSKQTKSKPLLFAPAMNTRMWEHPITEQHIRTWKSLGFHYIPPIKKKLACGDTGVGAMAEVDTLVAICFEKLLTDET